jgi:hypothetical protein
VDVADALVHGVAGGPARLTVVAGVPQVRDGVLLEQEHMRVDRPRFVRLGQRLASARARIGS